MIERADTKKVYYDISEQESRVINVAKLCLAILVVFLHSYADGINFSDGVQVYDTPQWLHIMKSIISKIICTSAVPAFFIISSLLLYKKEYNYIDNLKNKVKSLLVPYILVNSFWILFYFCAQQIPMLSIYFSNSGNIVENWKSIDWIDAYFGFSGFPMVGQLWFLRDLFVLNILSKVIKKIIDRFPRLVFIGTIIFWISNIPTGLFFLNRQAIVFFVLGYYVVKYNIRLDILKNIKKYKIVILYLVFVIFDMITMQIENKVINIPIHNVDIFVGIIILLCICSKLKNNKYLLKLSNYSFGLYLFHNPALASLKKILIVIMPKGAISEFIQYLGTPIIIIVLCIQMCMFLNKFFPGLYNLLMGNRKK